MRKKVDARVRTLIENGVKLRHRSLFVIVGDGGRDQVVNLHHMLSKAVVKARPSVLWCYKKELGFTSHRKKRARQVKKMIQRGLLDPEKDDPFELFISATDINYCYYKETARVLGNTFGMLVLQDFEAVTPNVLARTIETVEGGGIVVLLLKSMDSLKQLYTMSMDAHARFRTEAHANVQPRFNERFILSLASCAECLVLDDELNVLPISTHCRSIKPVADPNAAADEDDAGGASSGSGFALAAASGAGITGGSTGMRDSRELRELKASLRDTQPVGSIVSKVATIDQAKAVLTFVEAAAEKSLRTTVALTAGRGRGKSAALGLALAAAIAYGYANIFVTSPSPENLKTLFQVRLSSSPHVRQPTSTIPCPRPLLPSTFLYRGVAHSCMRLALSQRRTPTTDAFPARTVSSGRVGLYFGRHPLPPRSRARTHRGTRDFPRSCPAFPLFLFFLPTYFPLRTRSRLRVSSPPP